MRYGAKNPMWAPMSAEGNVSTAPTYGEAIQLDKLSQVDDKLTLTNTSAYGSDEKAVEITEFTSGSVDVSLLNMDEAVVSKMHGVQTGKSGGLNYKSDDLAPFGAFGFTTSCMDGSGKRYYEAVFYPKLKGKPTDKTYNTKGENVTLALDNVSYTMYQAACGTYKVTKKFDTEKAAQDYLAGLFAGTSDFPGMGEDAATSGGI